MVLVHFTGVKQEKQASATDQETDIIIGYEDTQSLNFYISNSPPHTEPMDTEQLYPDQCTAQTEPSPVVLTQKHSQKVHLSEPIENPGNNRPVVFYVKPNDKQSVLGGKCLIPKEHKRIKFGKKNSQNRQQHLNNNTPVLHGNDASEKDPNVRLGGIDSANKLTALKGLSQQRALNYCTQCKQLFTSWDSFEDHMTKAHNVSTDELLMKRLVKVSGGELDTEFLDSIVSEPVSGQASEEELAVRSILTGDTQSQTRVKGEVQLKVGSNKANIETAKTSFGAHIRNTVGMQSKTAAKGDTALVCKSCKLEFPSQATFLNHGCIQYKKHRAVIRLARQCDAKWEGDNKTDKQCSTCGKCFQHNNELNRHRLIHGPPLYMCEHCGYQCHYYGSLTSHVKRAHLKLRPHQCTVCGMSFFSKGTLRGHLTIHNPARNFECSECGKKFKRKGLLQSHSRVHEVEKRYACPYCPQEFRHRCNMRTHVRNVHHVEIKPILPASKIQALV